MELGKFRLKPSLTENYTKYYINNSLKEARLFKDKYITIFVNILLFLILGLVIGGLLFYKYKGKLTPAEKKLKDNQKKMYLYKKLQLYSYNKQKESQNLITNLPLIHPETNL